MPPLFALVLIACTPQNDCQLITCEAKPTIEECYACRHTIRDALDPTWRIVGQGECAEPLFHLDVTIRKDTNQ